MTIRIVRVHGVAAALICCVIAASSWQAAVAAEPGFYVGASYGQMKSGADKTAYDAFAASVYNDVGFTPAQNDVSFDTKDFGYGFGGGYRMFANLAFEGGYMDLGEISYRDQSTGTINSNGAAASVSQNLRTSTSGLAVSVLGILPLSYRTEIYARGGVMFATNDVSIFITDGARPQRGSGSKSSTIMLGGIGAGFTFAEIYTARLEYQRVFDAGLSDFGKADVDVISVGVTVTF